jgi:hypothetical protein
MSATRVKRLRTERAAGPSRKSRTLVVRIDEELGVRLDRLVARLSADPKLAGMGGVKPAAAIRLALLAGLERLEHEDET